MRLFELRSLYGDNKFIISQYNDLYKTVIVPKEVTIKEDLTVWNDGSCIINGMLDKAFIHSKKDLDFVKQKLFEFIDADETLDKASSKNLKSLKLTKKRL